MCNVIEVVPVDAGRDVSSVHEGEAPRGKVVFSPYVVDILRLRPLVQAIDRYENGYIRYCLKKI